MRVKPRKCAECGKRRYATREAAEQVLSWLQETRDPSAPKVEQRAYFAHGWWHLSALPEWEC